MRDKRITGFVTAMTGELFALLRGHGLLAAQLGAAVMDGIAFREGVERGKARDLQASLFGIRAAKLLAERGDEDAASYASGLLIGADVAARLENHREEPIYILADRALGELYAVAIEANGGSARLVESHDAFAAGISAIREAIS